MSTTKSSSGPSGAASTTSTGSEGAASLIESIAQGTASDSQWTLFADKSNNEERFRARVLRQEGVYRVKKEGEKLADRLHAALVHVAANHDRLPCYSLSSKEGEDLPGFSNTASPDREAEQMQEKRQSVRACAWNLAEDPANEEQETALLSELQLVEDAYALITSLLPDFALKDRLYGGRRFKRIQAALERFEKEMERAALEARSSIARKSSKRGGRNRPDAQLHRAIDAWKEYLEKKYTTVISSVANERTTASDMRLYLSKAQNDPVFKALLQKMEREYRLLGLQGSLLGSFEKTGYVKAARLRNAIEKGAGLRLSQALFPPDERG